MEEESKDQSTAKRFNDEIELSPKLEQEPIENSDNIIKGTFDEFDKIGAFLKSKNSVIGFSQLDKMTEYFINEINNSKINSRKKTWRRNFFIIAFYVKIFLSKLKKKIRISQHVMEERHLKLINDKTYFFYPPKKIKHTKEKNKTNSKIYKFCKKTKRLLIKGQSYIQQHTSFIFQRKTYTNYYNSLKERVRISIKERKFERKLRIIWDLFIFWVLFLEMWYIPLYVSFDQDLEQGEKNNETHNLETNVVILFQSISCGVFIADIVFNIFCGYYKKGLFITEKSKIFSHYLSKQFWTDSITLGFLMNSVWFGGSRYYSLIFMINIVKLNKIRKKMMFNFSHYGRIAFFVKLSSLSFIVFFLSHLFACTWYLVAILEVYCDRAAITWVHKADLYYDPWYNKYVYSFYYSIVTIVTVGYGDVTPQNPLERLLSCFFILIGCITFGYCINCIGSIFQEMSQEHNNFIESIAEIDNYMKKRNVDLDLQIRVRNYLEWVFKEENESREKEDLILKPLSKSLREEVLYQVYGQRIKKINIFTENFSKDFLNILALKARELSFVPDEIIFRQNQLKNQGFYFICKGEIETFVSLDEENNQNQLSFTVLKNEEAFGISYFLTGFPEKYSARSLSVSRVLFIDREDMLEILKDFTDDLEIFMALKDKHYFYNSNFELGILCFACFKSDHSVFTCPFIHFKADKEHMALKLKYSENQHRVKKRRRRMKSKNALKLKKIMEFGVCKLSFENYYASRKRNRLKDAVFRLENINEEEKENIYQLTPIETYELKEDEFNFKMKCEERERSEINSEAPKSENALSNKEEELQINLNAGNNEESRSTSVKSFHKNSILNMESNDLLNYILYKEEIKLDAMKSYKCYFPHNNVENVIKICSFPLARRHLKYKKKAVKFIETKSMKV